MFSLIFREALRNGKVASNPARLVRQRHEDNGRIRYLLDDEEQRLREVIVRNYPEHLPELAIALGTGQRKSEQYWLEWPQIDFTRCEVHLRNTKNGDARDIPMNSDVVTAFQSLMPVGKKPTGRVFAIHDSRARFEPWRGRDQGFPLARLPSHVLLSPRDGWRRPDANPDHGRSQDHCYDGPVLTPVSQHPAFGR